MIGGKRPGAWESKRKMCRFMGILLRAAATSGLAVAGSTYGMRHWEGDMVVDLVCCRKNFVLLGARCSDVDEILEDSWEFSGARDLQSVGSKNHQAGNAKKV